MIEPNGQFELDFSNVNEIKLNDIQRLLDLQKLAIFNEISIKVENLTPAICKIMEQTGLYKTFKTIGATEKRSLNKRLGLAVK